VTAPSSVDLVVVGGGVIGLSVGYEAASRGLAVLVLERDEVGQGAGRAAAGMLAPFSRARSSTSLRRVDPIPDC